MAAKLVDKVLNFMGFEEEVEEEERQEKHVRERVESREEQRWPKKKEKEKATVFNLHTQRQVHVIVVEPKSFDEVQGITDNLKNRCPVIVNLEQAEPDLAKRIVDFVSGSCYALNGSLQKVGTNIFLFVPNNMDISSDLREKEKERERENEKVMFPWIVQK